MTVYLSIYGFASIVALLRLWRQNAPWPTVMVAFVAPMSFFIGYRYLVGVDWITYELIFSEVYRLDFWPALTFGDGAYSLLNWLVGRFGGQIWHVNLICAIIFAIGLGRFLNVQALPGLAFAVSIPALVFITAMGYTRQATAIGCILLAYSNFKGSIDWRWLGYLVLATLFHKSAIIAFPMFIMAGSAYRWATYLIGGVIAATLGLTVISQGLADVLSLYFEGDLDSSGTLPRVAINGVVGLTYFLIRDRKTVFGNRNGLLFWFAVFMVVLLPAYFVIPSTTVVDRIGVLLIPFQGAILSGLVFSLRGTRYLDLIAAIAILIAYFITLFVWLRFATFASFWVPYANVAFERWP